MMAAINLAHHTDTDELNRIRTRDVYRRRKQRMLNKLQRSISQQVSDIDLLSDITTVCENFQRVRINCRIKSDLSLEKGCGITIVHCSACVRNNNV